MVINAMKVDDKRNRDLRRIKCWECSEWYHSTGDNFDVIKENDYSFQRIVCCPYCNTIRTITI